MMSTTIGIYNSKQKAMFSAGKIKRYSSSDFENQIASRYPCLSENTEEDNKISEE